MEHIDKLRLFSRDEVKEIAERWDTPTFAYDEKTLIEQAQKALEFPAAYGVTVRYAMKANPNHAIVRLFNELGIQIDASSEYEALRAISIGIDPEKILLTSQELPKQLKSLVEQGVQFNACSLHQLQEYGKQFPGTEVSIRINPGLGSGHSAKTNVGGPASSFGIWHEHTDQVKKFIDTYDLTVSRLHTHIGSGSNPEVWARVASLSLKQVNEFSEVKTLNLGGGFKVARMKDEISTDLQHIGTIVADEFESFADETGRKLHLEIEPGTFLTANCGSLITTIQDKTDTGEEGFSFLKIDSGMTEIMRPSLYGSQHPLVVVNGKNSQHEKYVVVGHCCESGDLLTPYPDDPEALLPRLMQRAEIGDLLVVESVGAYCASMSARNYNSFPRSAEVLKRKDGSFIEIARRGTMEDILRLNAMQYSQTP